MGIYLPNMEMPKDGHWGTVSIPFYIHGDGSVTDSKGHTIGSAVPVPPHGRLIDSDALEKDVDKYIGGEESRSRFHHWVQVQRTVIPESEEART